MNGTRNKKIITNIIVVYILIISSFIGIISFDGIIEIDKVSASGIIIVDCNGQGNYTKIQDAIDNAKSEDSIYVLDGAYIYQNLEYIISQYLKSFYQGYAHTN